MLTSFPSAIIRFVSAIVVDTTDGCSWRSFAHVGKEVGEGQPSFTDGDASSSVARPAIIGWVSASLDHLCPRAVGWGCSRFSVMSVFPAMGFFKSLTAAAGFSVDCVHWFFNAAITSNKPTSLAELPNVGKLENGQSLKAQTSDIFESRHGDLSRRWLGLETARRFSGGPFRYYSTWRAA